MVMATLTHRSGMPDFTPPLGLDLMSIKTSVDDGQLLTDEQLETVVRGFEEGGFKEARHAAGIISRGKITDEVWETTHQYLFDLLERASTGGTLDGDLSRAACKAARVVAQANSDASVEPSIPSDLGESLIRDGTSSDGDPWLTTAGTLLVSAAMDAADYETPDEIAKRIAEHLLALWKKTEGTREANLAAAGYSVLGRMSGGDHARSLVAESIDHHQYLLRTEPNLREGFLRFAARLAEDDPASLEPYAVELATHLRASSFAVRRDAARAFAALSGDIDWEALKPGVHTLDGPFENDGPMFPLFALNFLHQVAEHDPDIIPERVGDAFIRAVRDDERFVEAYGSATAAENGALSRAILFPVLESLAPRFPALVDAAGDGVFNELLSRDDEDVDHFVAAVGGSFAAIDPDAVGEKFVQYLAGTVPQSEQERSMDGHSDVDAPVRPAVSRFVTRMSEFKMERALSTGDRFVTLANERGITEQNVVGLLLLLVDRERDDDELASNFQSVIERATSEIDGDARGWADDLLEGESDDSVARFDSV